MSDPQTPRRDLSNLLRDVGGLLLAAGALTLFIRKDHEWSSVALLFVLLVPAALLYLTAIGALDRSEPSPRSSQALLIVAAVLLSVGALFQLLHAAGANTNDDLYGAGVFALTGLLAAYGAARARAPYAALLSGLSFLLAWLLLWEKILSHPGVGTYRWLLVVAAALLFAVALALMRRDALGAREVSTAGGVAAVAAGVLGLFVSAAIGVDRLFDGFGAGGLGASSSKSSGFGASGSAASSSGSGSGSGSLFTMHREVTVIRHAGVPHVLAPHGAASATLNSLNGGAQHFGWDLYLLIVSIALLWIAARVRGRGLGYVGGFGLLGFVVSVGEEVARVVSGKPATHSLLGWPLVLLLVGLAGLAAPLLKRREG